MITNQGGRDKRFSHLAKAAWLYHWFPRTFLSFFVWHPIQTVRGNYIFRKLSVFILRRTFARLFQLPLLFLLLHLKLAAKALVATSFARRNWINLRCKLHCFVCINWIWRSRFSKKMCKWIVKWLSFCWNVYMWQLHCCDGS